jgi:low affinity Fe/Cu permease
MSAEKAFTRFASFVARQVGRPVVFILCCLSIVAWAATGPYFNFSDTWQLIINTGTTIVTFLMVFLIQNTQNRDGAAIQAKLDELIRATAKARNSIIGIEHLTDVELERIRKAIEERSHCAEARGDAAAEAAADAVDRGEDPFRSPFDPRPAEPAKVHHLGRPRPKS